MEAKIANNNEYLLEVGKKHQEKIVKGLIEKSKPSSPYNLLLISSAIITVCGLLMDNIPIVIGGMLVTPMLSPFLSFGLGMAVGETKLIYRSFKIIFRSLLIVLLISAFLGFIIQTDMNDGTILGKLISDSYKIAFLYMIVALVSGAIGAFSWAHQKISEALPGVAISVSIIPPLAAMGISIGILSADLMRLSILIFILNFLGVVLGSLSAFAMMNFHKAKQETREELNKEENNKA